MESAGQDLFRLKQNLDYPAIEREDFPRQSEFTLSEKDIKNILKFLKKHEVSNSETEIVARKSKDSKLKINKESIEWEIRGDSIDISTIRHTAHQNGISYVKFFLDDTRKIVICYKYNNQVQKLTPCYLQYQGKRYFYNKAYLVEFGYKKTPIIIEEPSWWSRNWTSFTEWCSSIWCTICGWF